MTKEELNFLMGNGLRYETYILLEKLFVNSIIISERGEYNNFDNNLLDSFNDKLKRVVSSFINNEDKEKYILLVRKLMELINSNASMLSKIINKELVELINPSKKENETVCESHGHLYLDSWDETKISRLEASPTLENDNECGISEYNTFIMYRRVCARCGKIETVYDKPVELIDYNEIEMKNNEIKRLKLEIRKLKEQNNK